MELKNLMQTTENFCEVFALKFSSFSLSTVSRCLSVVQVLLSTAAAPNFHCCFAYLRTYVSRKTNVKDT